MCWFEHWFTSSHQQRHFNPGAGIGAWENKSKAFQWTHFHYNEGVLEEEGSTFLQNDIAVLVLLLDKKNYQHQARASQSKALGIKDRDKLALSSGQL